MYDAEFIIGISRLPLILIGLIGQLLSFLVFSRKKFTKCSISVYFRALAIADCFTVYRFVYDIFSYFYDIKISTQSNFMCKMSYFIVTGLSPISVWILAAFSIDKMIHALGKSKKFAFIEKKSFQYATVLVIVSVHCFIYSYLPIMIQLKQVTRSNGNTSVICFLPNIPHYKYISGLILVEANVVPFGLMMLTTLVIVKCLIQSRTKLERSQRRSLQERRRKDAKFAVNSVILNVCSVIFQMPIALSFLVLPNPGNKKFSLIFTIIIFLFYLSYSIRFFVHCTFNRVFRQEFLLMLRVKKQLPLISRGSTVRNRSKRHTTITTR
jgi:hypothetical protein